MKISLRENKGFTWQKNERISLKGYFYFEGVFVEKKQAINFLEAIPTKEDFLEIVPKLNGVFTILIRFDNFLFITTDTTRIFPVFYTFQKNETFISDDILFLKNTLKIEEFDSLAEIELKASLHTHGKKTLLKNVFQLQSNECICFENNDLKNSSFTFSYAQRKELKTNYNELKNEAISVFQKAFERLKKSLDGKTAVIPLSGGFDSRLIAAALYNLNYTNIICYTYGRKDSFEIENSKKTAKTLKFSWHFIEYTDELIKDFSSTNEFKDFAHYAGKCSSMPNLQEFFAVKYLKEQHLIPKNAVFISGYAGDLLGGSQYIKVIPKKLKSSEIIDLILSSKFINSKLSSKNRKILKTEIAKKLMNFDENYLNKIPSTVFEDYDIKEKISKYIFNSASFYTFFGYEVRFPFWDKEVLTFFKNVPIEQKEMKKLYDDILVKHYFEPNNISFEKELQPSLKVLLSQQIKNKIRPFLPAFLKQKFLKKNDWINYDPITKELLMCMDKQHLKTKLYYHSYNEIIVKWYIYFCKNDV